MNKLWIILVFLASTAFAQEQNIWSVRSEDNKVVATNYVCEDGGIDSVIVKSEFQRFRFVYGTDDNFLNWIVVPSLESSFIVVDVCHVSKDRYFVLGRGGDIAKMFSIYIIFFDKEKIVKRVILQSIDRLFNHIRFNYDEVKSEFVFRRDLVNELDPTEIYEVDMENKEIKIIQEDVERHNEYLLMLPKKVNKTYYTYSYTDVCFYKLKF